MGPAPKIIAHRFECLAAEPGQSVVRARDLHTGNDVALRFLKRRARTDAVRVASRILEPSLVRPEAFGEDRGVGTFVATEWVPGTDLRAALESGPLTVEVSLRVVERLAMALTALHDAGVTHGSIDPAHVLLPYGTTEQARLLFDLAPAAALGFRAPESIARGGEAGDVYSLGCVWFALLTGRGPFLGNDADAVRAQTRIEGPPSIRELRAEIPVEIGAMIERLLETSPDARPDAATLLRSVRTLSRAASTPRHLLPRDDLFGRDDDLERLASQHAASRLVTLLGPAGVGKTRLSLAYAERLAQADASRIVFCDLTETRTLPEVIGAVSSALHAHLASRSDRDAVVELGRIFRSRGDLLVILDNGEPVVGPLGECLASWLGSSSSHFIVTSREALKISGERVYEVAPLRVPSPGSTDSDGVRLFVDRARRARSTFEMTPATAPVVAELVRRLDGLPLAIELAASRVAALGVQEILERLSERFALLASNAPDVAPRHKTLRAALDGSWELLSPFERQALAQCSVFRGSFSLRAAEGVVRWEPAGAGPPLLDVIQSLCEKSLVRRLASDDDPEQRFGFYESVRDYARMRLQEGGATDDVAARHTAHFVAASAHWARSVQERGDAASLHPITKDRENLLEVVSRSLASDTETAGAAAGAAMLALAPVFFRRGPQSEYISLLSSTLAHAGLRDPRQRGRLLLARSEALAGAGRWDASTTDAEEAASAGRAAGDRWVEARALTRLGRSACFRGDDALAIELSRRAAELHAQDADPWEASAVGELGVALGNLGRLEDARRALERAVALARRSGQLFLEGFHQGNLAVALARVGARGDARRAFEQAILTMTLVDFAPIVAMNRSNLGLFLQEEGELDAALRCHDEALAQMGQTGFELLIARVRYSRASALHERGDFEEALVAYSEARLALMACSSPLEAAMPLAGSGAVSAALDRIDDAEAAFLLAEDELAHVSPETKAVVRVHRGHLHLARGRAHARQGDRAEAVREGREAVQAAGTAPPSKDRDEFRFAVRVLQRALRDAHLLADDTEPGSVFRIDALGRWFQPPRRDRVELRRRPNLQAILAHLVERARIAPGAPTSVAALLAAGWPGEKVIPKAGRARTHVAMSTLRKLGMREVLVNVDGGYLLDPAAVIVTPADEPVTS